MIRKVAAAVSVAVATKVELAYALAHPDHVERLLLDSVVATSGPDPLALDMLQGIPLGLSALCGNASCRGFPSPGRFA